MDMDKNKKLHQLRLALFSVLTIGWSITWMVLLSESELGAGSAVQALAMALGGPYLYLRGIKTRGGSFVVGAALAFIAFQVWSEMIATSNHFMQGFNLIIGAGVGIVVVFVGLLAEWAVLRVKNDMDPSKV